MCKLPYEKEKYEILVKREEETNEKYGYDPWKRPIGELLDFSIINLDKPKGPYITSGFWMDKKYFK
nr:hypothetical protein [Candidatus Nanopusillus massiliensis]